MGQIEGSFGGLKFSIPGFFSGRKIWQVFFGVASDGMMKKQTQTFNF